MADIFGYNRTGQPFAQITSSEFAIISLGTGGGGSLMQSISGSYQQDLRPFFSIGDPNLYWVGGFAQGQVDFERAVSNRGFFNGLKGNCGVISSLSINAGQGQRCATAGGGGSGGTLAFGGVVLQSVRFRIQAGQSEVIEGASLRVSDMQS